MLKQDVTTYAQAADQLCKLVTVLPVLSYHDAWHSIEAKKPRSQEYLAQCYSHHPVPLSADRIHCTYPVPKPTQTVKPNYTVYTVQTTPSTYTVELPSFAPEVLL